MFIRASARHAAQARNAVSTHHRERRLVARSVAVGFALVASLGIPNVIAATQSPTEAGFHGSGTNTSAWLVRFKPGVAHERASSTVAASGATELGVLSDINTAVLNLPAGREQQALARLAADPNVLSVERDGTYQAAVVPKDPHWAQAWGPKLIRAPEAWNVSTGISSTVIAIVDTGVDSRQPDLRGRVLRGWDFVGNDANPRDDNGHGTAVAGVAAAGANDGVGIAGLCWHCKVLPVKVLNAAGSGSYSNIAAGIIWAAKHGADVINMSLAGAYPSPVVADAVAYARNHGVVIVAAAGNEGSSRHFYPAAYPGVISVGATNSSDRMYSWSNRGKWVKVAAPGCAYTGKPGARWSWWCGTSFASPVVAGIAALMKSMQPGLGRSAIEHTLLRSTVRARGVVDGRVDAARAMRTALSLVTPTNPTPTATTWSGQVDADNPTRKRTFTLSGAVRVRLTWSADAAMSLKVTDSAGKTLVAWDDTDGDITWSKTLQSGDYTVQVSEWSDTWTSFKVTIED